MRVIAGTARRLLLKTIDGFDTRPTTDRIKETLFNMIHDDLYDALFLDLFSGSGAIGIEALSRGAKKAYFVENNKKAVNCIKENLIHTKLISNADVLNQDAQSAIRILADQGLKFEFIYMDPPFSNKLEKEILIQLLETELLAETGMIIVESDLDTKFQYLDETKFEIIKQKKYKTSMHTFITIGGTK